MAELIAKQNDTGNVVARWNLTEGMKVTLGRMTTPAEADWMVESPNRYISKQHVDLTWQNGTLTVQRRETGKNPVFMGGADQGYSPFEVKVGESFSIGDLTFQVSEEISTVTQLQSAPQQEFTYSSAELRRFRFSDADRRIEILARLPEVIRYTDSEEALQDRVLAVLLDGIPRATSVGVVRLVNGGAGGFRPDSIRTAEGTTQPVKWSQRLIEQAINQRKQSVFHCWYPEASRDIEEYTSLPNYTWAFCIPVLSDYTPDRGLYVSGKFKPIEVLTPGANVQELIKGDLKYAELVADIYNSLLAQRALQTRNAYLERFMSRSVLESLITSHTDLETALQHRLADVAVLFCDLRGSCGTVERGQADLESTWNSIQDALEVMTKNIVERGGVISDFQGDAVMGFWGWPIEDPHASLNAVRAALAIQSDFVRERFKDRPAGSYSFGIGIASGEAIAGKLGTFDQFKLGVFGPPVNLASRLEGLTQFFQAPILVDEVTASRIVAVSRLNCELRRVARVLPSGMSQPVNITQLVNAPPQSRVTVSRLCARYARGLQAFEEGDWANADAAFANLPEDGPSRVLRMYMGNHNNTPPENWDGVIRFGSKYFFRNVSSS